MDIIAALHWIQENIEGFGGDPRSVTLAGHGTGAACVHFLIASAAVPEGELINSFCLTVMHLPVTDVLFMFMEYSWMGKIWSEFIYYEAVYYETQEQATGEWLF